MNVWTEPNECQLCGYVGRTHEVVMALVAWLEALPGMGYAHVPRCLDRAACRSRVEAFGRSWPVKEGTDR